MTPRARAGSIWEDAHMVVQSGLSLGTTLFCFHSSLFNTHDRLAKAILLAPVLSSLHSGQTVIPEVRFPDHANGC
jgi:hypothetical protein